MVSPVAETAPEANVNPNAAKAKKDPEEDSTGKAQDEAQAKEDAMFQALLNSQREILAKLDFGGSNSDMQFVEGPDNLPLVSPHNSGEFNLVSGNEEFDYRYDQCEPHPPKTHSHSHSQFQSFPPQQQPYQQSYNYQQQRQAQQPYHQGFEQVNVDGIGDDRFILEEIEIASSDNEDKGPATFDIDIDPAMRNRKRDMEQEMVQAIKKRRNGSNHGTTPSAYDNLLPSLNDSSSSLDFASLHSTTGGTTETEPSSMWKPRNMDPKENNNSESTLKTENRPEENSKMEEEQQPEGDSKPKAMDTKDEKQDRRPAPPRRSSRNLWQPRQRRSSELSVEEKRSMWKPRNRNTPSPHHDSVASLDVQDLDASTPEQPQKVFHVSIGEGDIQRQCPSRSSSNGSAASIQSMPRVFQRRCPSRSSSGGSATSLPRFTRRCPSRSSSNDSTGSVQSLSEALQQSRGSTMSIQEWDKKMGLKRSHSKTMRQSAKSREQLLAFLQKEQQAEIAIPQTIAVETIQEEESALAVEL